MTVVVAAVVVVVAMSRSISKSKRMLLALIVGLPDRWCLQEV